jgi:pyruvate-ferredoxin/flavodoxin oxidoreductase
MAGELLPAVLHVSARALASHALSIFGDHQDVMACRQTGFAMLASASVQEVMDLSGVAHLTAIKGRVPFLNFFDGFRTSHELQKIEVMDYEDLKGLLDMDAVRAFKKHALNPETPALRGTAQNPDIFFQAREASNPFYLAVPELVEDYMKKISDITGREYKLFNYYGAEDADRVIIAMGSACDAIKETIDYLMAKGEKVGLVNVHLYRPFSIKHFLSAIPATAKKIAVLDRTKEPGALGEPLYLDVCTAFFEQNEHPVIVGGRYGLGSKDTTPAQILAVYENLNAKEPKNKFTIGINDDVTYLSLPVGPEIDAAAEGTKSCKFWGLGSDGTVGANKNSIKIIGDHTNMYAQAYFHYDSKKSGGITQSHLRFGKQPIRSTYLVTTADFVACHQASYLTKYDMYSDLKDGGKFLLNCTWTAEELEQHIPADMKQFIAKHNIKLFTIDATNIAKEIGLGNRTNTVLQAAFFKLTNIIPVEEVVKYMKDAIYKSYGKKGDDVVNKNYAAVDKGIESAVEIQIPASWADATDAQSEAASALNIAALAPQKVELNNFVKSIVNPVNAQKGDKLPVSTFVGYEDGTFPQGTAAYEKRGIAVDVPVWDVDKCIQCNQCSYVCPHAAIRPVLVSEEEMAKAPETFAAKQATGKGLEGYKFKIQVNVLDCMGCGNCVQVCPAKEKALVMKTADTQQVEIENWKFVQAVSVKENPMNAKTVKGSQFETPLFEFSGACAGCGETPYAKLVTQLFGDRMYIANATGCSSIWGGSAPSTPYTTNEKGFGPAWANSLFEDNAEYGFGMYTAVKQIRARVKDLALSAIESDIKEESKAALQEWADNMDKTAESKAAAAKVVEALTAEKSDICKEILDNKEHLVKKSQWIFGGDGWAYDIGFGGLDHVLASGEDVNVFVFDTEVYSNTGGQSSKSTPAAAVAQFAASGKKVKKKDLGMIAMSYGYVYVAQVGMGANQKQLIDALIEAESYPGPSLIIAYAPCINHGLKVGMGCTQLETKLAVEAGYWHLYRYNPLLAEQGKNPFILDSKDPTGSFRDFILSEVRYSSLARSFPEIAEQLFEKAEKDAQYRLNSYKTLANNN